MHVSFHVLRFEGCLADFSLPKRTPFEVSKTQTLGRLVGAESVGAISTIISVVGCGGGDF